MKIKKIGKKVNINFTLDKTKICKWLFISLMIIALGTFLGYIIFPLTIRTMLLLLTIGKTYLALTDINFQFIGMIFFFLVLWRVLTAFCEILMVVTESFVKYIKEK